MKILKKRMIWSVIIALAGIILFVVNIFQNGSNSITMGFASGIIGVSIIKKIQFYRISRNPQLIKKYEISQKEERAISIAEKSGLLTFFLTIIGEFGAIFVLILFDKNEIATTVSFVAGIQSLIYLASHYYFSKKY